MRSIPQQDDYSAISNDALLHKYIKKSDSNISSPRTSLESRNAVDEQMEGKHGPHITTKFNIASPEKNRIQINWKTTQNTNEYINTEIDVSVAGAVKVEATDITSNRLEGDEARLIEMSKHSNVDYKYFTVGRFSDIPVVQAYSDVSLNNNRRGSDASVMDSMKSRKLKMNDDNEKENEKEKEKENLYIYDTSHTSTREENVIDLLLECQQNPSPRIYKSQSEFPHNDFTDVNIGSIADIDIPVAVYDNSNNFIERPQSSEGFVVCAVETVKEALTSMKSKLGDLPILTNLSSRSSSTPAEVLSNYNTTKSEELLLLTSGVNRKSDDVKGRHRSNESSSLSRRHTTYLSNTTRTCQRTCSRESNMSSVLAHDGGVSIAETTKEDSENVESSLKSMYGDISTPCEEASTKNVESSLKFMYGDISKPCEEASTQNVENLDVIESDISLRKECVGYVNEKSDRCIPAESLLRSSSRNSDSKDISYKSYGKEDCQERHDTHTGNTENPLVIDDGVNSKIKDCEHREVDLENGAGADMSVNCFAETYVKLNDSDKQLQAIPNVIASGDDIENEYLKPGELFPMITDLSDGPNTICEGQQCHSMTRKRCRSSLGNNTTQKEKEENVYNTHQLRINDNMTSSDVVKKHLGIYFTIQSEIKPHRRSFAFNSGIMITFLVLILPILFVGILEYRIRCNFYPRQDLV